MAAPTETELEQFRTVEPSLIDLKTPLLERGMSKRLLCAGDNSTLRIHCYSTGMGEKHGLHAHTEEEHVFVVLQGTAVFSGIKGKLPPLEKNHGIWLPRGCFYEFYNPGPDPLVVLRFGAVQKGGNESRRVTPEGAHIPGRSTQFPELAVPKVIEGAFFE